MVNFGPAEILFGLLVFLFCSLIAGMFLGWGWVVQQLVLRRPILPDQAIVSRLAETPWRVGTVLLVVLAYLVVSWWAHCSLFQVDRAQSRGSGGS